MRVLIAASGSYGDVYPFIGLARELRSRGHRTALFANEYFRHAAQAEGLEFIAVGTTADYDRIVRDPQLWHPRRGLKVVMEAVTTFTPLAYELLLRELRGEAAVLVGSTLAFGARLLRETHGVPLVTVHLAPSVFRSALDAICLPGLSIPASVPGWAKSGLWRLIDRFGLDPMILPALNETRRELGLPSVRRPFHRWVHSPDRVIGLFPDWFAQRRDDWPEQTRLTGFPLYDAAAHEPVPEGLERFLEAGAPPVLFAPGTANASAREFFETSVSACGKAGLRALLVTRYADQVPARLPGSVAHFPYLPFSKVLPRCCAFVNHGGIGSLSQGLRAGVPQLIRPTAFDQFDNARRAEDLGTARSVSVKRYRSENVAAALIDLDSSARRESCRRVSGYFEHDSALANAAGIVEELRR